MELEVQPFVANWAIKVHVFAAPGSPSFSFDWVTGVVAGEETDDGAGDDLGVAPEAVSDAAEKPDAAVVVNSASIVEPSAEMEEESDSVGFQEGSGSAAFATDYNCAALAIGSDFAARMEHSDYAASVEESDSAAFEVSAVVAKDSAALVEHFAAFGGDVIEAEDVGCFL